MVLQLYLARNGKRLCISGCYGSRECVFNITCATVMWVWNCMV